MFSAASIVWDREFGFLREMMVAPVRRSSIVIGKFLGGATVASFQGVILLASPAPSTSPTASAWSSASSAFSRCWPSASPPSG